MAHTRAAGSGSRGDASARAGSPGFRAVPGRLRPGITTGTQAAVNTELALGPSREDAEDRLFADLEPNLRAWVLERYTLHPFNI